MELVVARIDELRARLTESFEEWALLRQGYGGPAGQDVPLSCALSGGATALIFLGALRNANVDWSRISLFWDAKRQVSRAAAQRAVGDLQAKGVQFNEIAPAELARMRQIAKPVTEKFAASYDPTLVKLYNDELVRIRK